MENALSPLVGRDWYLKAAAGVFRMSYISTEWPAVLVCLPLCEHLKISHSGKSLNPGFEKLGQYMKFRGKMIQVWGKSQVLIKTKPV